MLVCSSTAIRGYVTNNTDCNDSDGTVWRNGSFYKDADGDGYTAGGAISLCYGSIPPKGYTATKSTADDCDDSNASVWRSGTFYTDKDGDSYTVSEAVYLCYGTTTPAGYAAIKSAADDCNDGDKNVWRNSMFYTDKDGDGYTVGSGISLCYGSSIPLGYATKKSAVDDCNDNDKSVNASARWVLDYDKDNYYTGSAVAGCTSPGTGYVLISATKGGGDCNDKNNKIYPGAKDGYDGIDNDCDGQTDEDYYQLSICDAKMYEGNSGQCYMLFVVSLNWIPCRNITVNYTTQDGTSATANKDYKAVSGKLTFYPGYLIQTIAVPVNGDKIKEGDETFKIVLSNPYNATLYRSTATGTILNDDGGKSTSSFIAGGINTADLTSAELTVKLSPMPARNTLTISLRGFEGKVMMQVFSADGRQVRQ